MRLNLLFALCRFLSPEMVVFDNSVQVSLLLFGERVCCAFSVIPKTAPVSHPFKGSVMFRVWNVPLFTCWSRLMGMWYVGCVCAVPGQPLCTEHPRVRLFSRALPELPLLPGVRAASARPALLTVHSVSSGKTLIKVAEAEKRLGAAERDFIHTASINFLTPLRNFLEGDWKTISVRDLGLPGPSAPPCWDLGLPGASPAAALVD